MSATPGLLVAATHATAGELCIISRGTAAPNKVALHPTAYRFADFAQLRWLRVVAAWSRRGRSFLAALGAAWLVAGARRATPRPMRETATAANNETACRFQAGSTPGLNSGAAISRRFFHGAVAVGRCCGVAFQAGSTPSLKWCAARRCEFAQRGARRPHRDSAQRARGGGRAGRVGRQPRSAKRGTFARRDSGRRAARGTLQRRKHWREQHNINSLCYFFCKTSLQFWHEFLAKKLHNLHLYFVASWSSCSDQASANYEHRPGIASHFEPRSKPRRADGFGNDSPHLMRAARARKEERRTRGTARQSARCARRERAPPWGWEYSQRETNRRKTRRKKESKC